VDVLDRMIDTMQHAWRAMGRHEARWVERDGIGALVTPAVPERSIVNSVVYKRGSDIAAAYDRLEEEFAAVQAWTVWVPDGDRATAEFLARRGHKLDANPAAMALNLRGWQPPVPLADWRPALVEDLARINDAAYPWRDGSLERAILGAAYDDVEFRLYITEDASVLGIDDCAGDAGVIFVATLPEARGRGLATGLLAAALVEARDRGCDISTLQATTAGEPVYARLGYERIGSFEMWEKRVV
jgi:GNAT superfamily N-acetyltransferase